VLLGFYWKKECMASKVKGIIFDLGKVVYDYSFRVAYDHWAKCTGLTFDIVRSSFSFDHFFEQYETGSISSEAFYNSVNNKLNKSLTFADFAAGWNSIFLNEVPGMNDMLVTLRGSYELVGLTNTNQLHKSIWSKKFNTLMANFSMIFCSCEIGYRKPEGGAFLPAIKYLNADPNEIIFLDDYEVNIEGAKQIGLKTIFVKSFGQMSQELDTALNI
jgi:glucose-1-phosphatase